MQEYSKSQFIWFIIAKLSFTIIIGLLFFFYNVENSGERDDTILYDTLYQSYQNIHQSAEQPKDDNFNMLITTTLQDPLQQKAFTDITITTLKKINSALHMDTILPLDKVLSHITIKDTPEKKRWYSNHNSIVLNINNLSPHEFIEVLTHEIGHSIDLGAIIGQSASYNEQFTEFNKKIFRSDDLSLLYYAFSRDSESRRKSDNNKDFCTNYGMTNPFEDFAECFNLYINHNNYFMIIKKDNTTLQKKYAFIQHTIDYTGPTTTISSWFGTTIDPHYRYWDSTKIDHN